MKLLIDKLRGKRLSYKPAFADVRSNDYQNLANDAREGLRRAAMRSDMKDIFQGTTVTGFEPTATYNTTSDSDDDEGVMVNFYIQVRSLKFTKIVEMHVTHKKCVYVNYL